MHQHTPEQRTQLTAAGGQAISLTTPDGQQDIALFVPTGQGPFPVVILYMDAFGLRPALYEIGKKLAEAGYYTLIPYLFYRSGPMPKFEPATAFSQPDTREQLMKLIGSYTKDMATSDTHALLAWAETQPKADTSRVGTVGYCMGGGLALTAAARFPEQVKATAAYHAGRLVSDAPDSPHRQGKAIKAKVYIGAADQDNSFTLEDGDVLRQAFDTAGTNYTLEFYNGALHGYTMKDFPVYDAEASKRHWLSLMRLFSEMLCND